MSTDIEKVTKRIRFSDTNPKGYYDWSDGVHVAESELNRWVKECIGDIQEQILTESNDVNPSAFRASGNSLVTCVAYRKEDGLYEMTVVVARNYYSAVIDDFNPRQTYEFIKVKDSSESAS